MREPKLLGDWLERARERSGTYKRLLFAVLAVLVGVNFLVLPRHPHFATEDIPGFWAVFALLGTVVMVAVLKKLVYPILARPEEPADWRPEEPTPAPADAPGGHS